MSIDDNGVVQIANNMTKLTHLDLSMYNNILDNNEIGDVGAK